MGPARKAWVGATVFALLFAFGDVASAASFGPVITRNRKHFVLRWEDLNFVGGGWTGEARFTLSACPEQSCFHVSGPINISQRGTTKEASFPMPGSSCVLHFEEVPRNGMDSMDYRLTLQGGKKCRSFPAGLNGLYRQAN